MYGPWFYARFEGECDECGVELFEGDTIRSDGMGGYLCMICGWDNTDWDWDDME